MIGDGRKLILFKEIGRVTERCDFGKEHDVKIFAIKIVRPTGAVRQASNGYTTFDSQQYVDAAGRSWWRHETIDFSGNVSWVLEDDPTGGGWWTTSVPFMPARDANGNWIGQPRPPKQKRRFG